MERLSIHVDGPEADAVVEELQAFLRQELGREGTVTRQAAVTSATSAEERADPVTVATRILAIPPALLASLDIAERLALKTKLDRLMAWAPKSRKRLILIQIERSNLRRPTSSSIDSRRRRVATIGSLRCLREFAMGI